MDDHLQKYFGKLHKSLEGFRAGIGQISPEGSKQYEPYFAPINEALAYIGARDESKGLSASDEVLRRHVNYLHGGLPGDVMPKLLGDASKAAGRIEAQSVTQGAEKTLEDLERLNEQRHEIITHLQHVGGNMQMIADHVELMLKYKGKEQAPTLARK